MILVAVSTSGCVNEIGGGEEGTNTTEVEAVDIHIQNFVSEDRFFDISVSDSDGEWVYRDNISVNGNGERRIENVTSTPGEYDVVVRTNDNQESEFRWRVSESYRHLEVAYVIENGSGELTVSQAVN